MYINILLDTVLASLVQATATS